jgi:hypothetical protein
MKYMPNRFAKKCHHCGVPVPSEEGFAFLKDGWETSCRSSQCLPQEIISDLTVREISEEGVIKMPYEQDALPILRGLPGAKFDWESKSWKVSIEPKDLPRVLEACRRLDLKYPTSFEENQDTSEVDGIVQRAISAGAFPHQIDGVRFLATHDRALLGDDMGLGKTFQSLIAIEGRAIVICPATLKSNWAGEVKKFRPDLTPIVCKGKKSFVLPRDGEVVILNYDILPSKIESVWLDDLSQTTLIADEAHLCKSFKAARSKKTTELASHCKKAWAMTGTPLLSRGFDLWGVLSTFNLGGEVFGGFSGFTRLMNAYKNHWGGWEFGEVDPSVPERMRRVMLRRLKTDVLKSLPPKTYQDILVEVGSKKLLKLSEKALELLKETDGALPPFEKFASIRAELAKDRIPALLELAESFEDAGEPVVVFSAHRAPIEAFSGRQGWAIIMGDTNQEDRQLAVDLFQEGLLKGIACTIKAGGVGLTLTRASKMIFCDMEWNPSLNVQAEDRICRIGQQADQLQYIRLVSDCEMDKHVLRLLDKKAKMIQDAIENEVEVEQTTHIVEETQEEMAKRVAKANASKAKQITQGAKVRDLPPEVITDLVMAFRDMLYHCDGAKSRDGEGFNATDAYTARVIFGSINQDPQVASHALEMIKKYKGQIGHLYPNLFN